MVYRYLSALAALWCFASCQEKAHIPEQASNVPTIDVEKTQELRNKRTYDTSKVQVVECKTVYDDELKQYIKATIVNRTGKTVKGIHAYLDNRPNGFLAYKVSIKPHGTATIKTEYMLCSYHLTRVIYKNGEFDNLLGTAGTFSAFNPSNLKEPIPAN